MGPQISRTAPPGCSTATTYTPTYSPSGKKTNPLTGRPGFEVCAPRYRPPSCSMISRSVLVFDS
jgi:hypothetical protein